MYENEEPAIEPESAEDETASEEQAHEPESEHADGVAEDGESEDEGEEAPEETPKADESKQQWAALRRKQKKARAQLESERAALAERAAAADEREQQLTAELRAFGEAKGDPRRMIQMLGYKPLDVINALVDDEGNLADIPAGPDPQDAAAQERKALRQELDALRQERQQSAIQQEQAAFMSGTGADDYPFLADAFEHGTQRAKQRLIRHAYEIAEEYKQRGARASADDLRKALESEIEGEYTARHTRLNKARPAQGGPVKDTGTPGRRRPTMDDINKSSNSRTPEDPASLSVEERVARAVRQARTGLDTLLRARG